MPVEIRPVGRKILFQIFETPAEEVLGGVVVRCAATRSEHRKAVVRRLPNGYRGDLRPGTEVLLKPYCGTEITADGRERLVFAPECEAVAILEG